MEISSKEMEAPPNSIPDPKVDATFRRIPKNSVSFSIWRIDDNRLDAEPRANYGVFLDNCAYIIYAAGKVGEYVNKDTLTREPKKGTHLERFLHFWLGANVSEQTRSNVAHKIQELDSYFGNTATEYRETQNNESARFLSYFKNGITINSSVLLASKNDVRLYQLYGRKCLRCIEMQNINWEHFNASYIMLLRTQDHLFVWIGRSSSAIERRHALEHATKHYAKNAGITIVDDGYEQSMPEDIKALWNLHLPLSARTVNQNVSSTEREQTHKIAIYKCCYRGKRLNLDQLDILFPSKDELNDSSTVYVLDAQRQGVWLWVGSQATQQDKTNAMGNGRAFVKKKKYPYATAVIRVVEGHEPIEFIRLFPHWHGYDWSDMYIIKPVSTVLGKFDSVTLCQRPKMAAETQLVDDGTGERIVYRITKDQVIELPAAKLTVFTTNNCYVVKYNVVFASVLPADIENVGIKQIIYQWNGAEASTDVITRTEIFARKLYEKNREKVMFMQMSEYDETPNFLQIFDGKLIIMQNEKYIHNNNNNISNNNGTTNNKDATCETLLSQEYYTLKVYGNASYNSKAVEVYPLSSLSSKECYIVKRKHIWVWCGQSSTGDAREVAKSIGNMLGECSLVLEGKEPKEFWLSVSSEKSPPVIINGGGGIGASGNGSNNTCNSSTSSRNSSNGLNGSISPQSNGSGGGYSSGYVTPPVTTKQRFQSQLLLVWMYKKQFQSIEIMGYEQGDLYPECMYILDAGLVIYVWLGSQINPSERERYMTLAQNYIEQIPLARRPTTALAIVTQNDEPNVFKGFFNEWDNNLWKGYVSYMEKRKAYIPEIEDNKSVINGNTNGVNGNSPLPVTLLNNQKDFDAHQKYPLHILQMEMDNLPPEVNPLRREVHLTHDDFVSIFKISYFEFDELPAWKQKELKKHNKLF